MEAWANSKRVGAEGRFPDETMALKMKDVFEVAICLENAQETSEVTWNVLLQGSYPLSYKWDTRFFIRKFLEIF